MLFIFFLMKNQQDGPGIDIAFITARKKIIVDQKYLSSIISRSSRLILSLKLKTHKGRRRA